MATRLSKSSISKLQTCHKDLQKLVLAMDEDILIIEGYRSEERQRELFKKGLSKLQEGGKHNKIPSDAIDMAPLPLDWEDTKRFYEFGKRVVAKAKELGIKIRWGGDWDGDGDFSDQKFNDLVHFERG